jgi:hypothetical protein
MNEDYEMIEEISDKMNGYTKLMFPETLLSEIP